MIQERGEKGERKKDKDKDKIPPAQDLIFNLWDH